MTVVTTLATDLTTRSRHVGAYGEATIFDSGLFTPTSNNNSGDIWKIMRIPAGVEIEQLCIINGDFDTNGSPTLACKVGYTPVGSSPAAVDDYFIASGSTILRAPAVTWADFKSGANGALRVDLDIDLIITLTAVAATWASVKLRMSAICRNLGIK
jgi:hypothetical protein